ncbi:MAG: hypoxanthine phosphoribosyltransferase [Planctomycetes bacterium]|nr:hypoxanthine phosphoribosyltransferase [Planctomycetota bacterium]
MQELLSAEEIERGVARMAGEIQRGYAGRSLTLVGVLTGSIVFLADLIRKLDLPVRVALVQARSYRGGATRPGRLVVHPDFTPDVAGRDILLVDDIFDTGQTLAHLLDMLDELGPTSIHSAVLLRKSGRAKVACTPDYVGFEIPDRFVVGYGLDYHDLYRHLPYLAALEEHELTELHPTTGRVS